MFDNGSRKGYYFIHQPNYLALNSVLSRHRTKYTDNFVFKSYLVLNSYSERHSKAFNVFNFERFEIVEIYVIFNIRQIGRRGR